MKKARAKIDKLNKNDAFYTGVHHFCINCHYIVFRSECDANRNSTCLKSPE